MDVIYRFGAYELDEGAGELRHRGAPVPVQPKPLALLALLVRERHRVVPPDELFEALWPGTAVTPGSLTRAVSLARRAIGDVHQGATLRSYSRRGYRFCGEVTEVGARPAREPQAPPPSSGSGAPPSPLATGEERAPLPSPAPDEGPLLGRAEALGALRAELDGALAGRGGLILVSGRPGIGKTRLVETFAAESAAAGPTVAIGRARQDEGVPAFWLWAQVLRRLLADPALAEPLREIDVGGGELGALLPELGTAGAAPPVGPEQRRFLLFDAIGRALARCSRERPLVVVLEDVQWAGEGSLRLLEHLAYELRSARVLLVVTARDEPRGDGDPVERLLGVLRAQPHAREIALRGLSRGEVAALLEHAIGRRPPSDLTAEVYARTEGVPLFLREAIRLLAERGDLRHPERLARRGLVLPSRSFDFIRRALAGLAPETARLVETAAVIGREFPIALLAAVAGTSREQAVDRMDEAERAGVVEPAPESAASWRFVHALHQEAALGGLSAGRRARLHQRTADALAEQHAADPDTVAAELAHHLHEALAVGDPERAFQAARRAAARARRLLAYEQAARHLEQALSALAHVSPADPLRRLETRLALGEAYREAGDRPRRRQAFQRALEDARDLERPEAFAEAAIGFCDVAEWAPRDPHAAAALREALERLGERPSVARARLLTRVAYLAARDDLARAVSVGRDAVAMARRLEDPVALQEALYTLHFVLASPHALEERAALAGESARTAERRGALDTTVIALIDVASDQLELGDAEQARRLRAEAERLAGTRPHPGMVWHLRVYDTGLAILEGRLAQAQRLMEVAHDLGLRIGHPYARGCYAAHRVGIARERGAHEEVVRIFEPTAARVPGPTQWARAVVGRSLVALGRKDEALALFEGLARDDFAGIPLNIRWIDTMVETAHLCADLGDAPRAPALAEQLRPVESHHGVLPVPICYAGPVAFAQARLLGLLGRRDEAEELLEEAFAGCAALGARPAQARVALAQWALLARRGERRRARERLGLARDLAEKLELPGAAAEARQQLAALGA